MMLAAPPTHGYMIEEFLSNVFKPEQIHSNNHFTPKTNGLLIVYQVYQWFGSTTGLKKCCSSAPQPSPLALSVAVMSLLGEAQAIRWLALHPRLCLYVHHCINMYQSYPYEKRSAAAEKPLYSWQTPKLLFGVMNGSMDVYPLHGTFYVLIHIDIGYSQIVVQHSEIAIQI